MRRALDESEEMNAALARQNRDLINLLLSVRERVVQLEMHMGARGRVGITPQGRLYPAYRDFIDTGSVPAVQLGTTTSGPHRGRARPPQQQERKAVALGHVTLVPSERPPPRIASRTPRTPQPGRQVRPAGIRPSSAPVRNATTIQTSRSSRHVDALVLSKIGLPNSSTPVSSSLGTNSMAALAGTEASSTGIESAGGDGAR